MTKVLIYQILLLKITVLYRMCVRLDKSDWSVFNCQCCSVPRPGAEVKANEIDQLDGGTQLIAHAYWDCFGFFYIHEAILPQLCYSDDYVFFILVYEKRYVLFFFFIFCSYQALSQSDPAKHLDWGCWATILIWQIIFHGGVEVYALGRWLAVLVECTEAVRPIWQWKAAVCLQIFRHWRL